MAVESVGSGEEHPSLSSVKRQMTGINGGLMAPWKTSKVLELVGHQVDDGVVVSPLGTETQREVSRYRSVFTQLFQIEVTSVDFVEESVGVVEVTPHFMGQTRGIASGAQIEEIAVFAGTNYVQFPKN